MLCVYVNPKLLIYPFSFSLWASFVAHLVKNLLAVQETWVRVLDQEDLLEEEMATHSVFLPGNPVDNPMDW